MTGRGEPSWQPIGRLPVIASLADEGLRDGREHYATLGLGWFSRAAGVDKDTIRAARAIPTVMRA